MTNQKNIAIAQAIDDEVLDQGGGSMGEEKGVCIGVTGDAVKVEMTRFDKRMNTCVEFE